MYKSRDNLNSSRVFLNQAMDSNFNPWKVTNNLSTCISLIKFFKLVKIGFPQKRVSF